jgi:4-hydroxybenzoate polyprenyltransferase
MKVLLRDIVDFLLYGNFFIAFCALAMTFQVCHLRYFSVAGSPLLIFIFSATFFIYNIHKFITFYLKKEVIENQRFIQMKRFDAPLSILTFIALLLCFDTYLMLGSDIKLFVAYIAFFSILYVLPVFNGKRLRDLPYIKIFIITGVWVSVCVALPALTLGKAWWTTDAVIALEKGYFIFALTLPFDMRDRAWDAHSGVKTIPLSMDTEKTKKLAYFALILSFLMAVVLVVAKNYSFWTLFKIGLSLVITYFIIKKTDDTRDDYFYMFGVDGMMLLQSLIVIFI